MKIIQKSLCNVPIAGIQALTTIDFPGKISAVFFTKGCPWQCRYCHNPSLRLLDTDNLLSGDYVKEFLRKRIGYLEGVVISGGEPTIHASLPRLLTWIRGLGYATALHTNGCFPEMLYLLIKKRLVNYVALDIKAPPKAYDRITQGLNTGVAVAKSIEIILSSGIAYEFRTTYHPALLSDQDLMDIVHAIARAGAKNFFFQCFRSEGVIDTELAASGNVIAIPEPVVEESRRLFPEFAVR